MGHPVETAKFNGTYDELPDGWFCFHGQLADGTPHLWWIQDMAIASRMETLGITNPLEALDACWQEVVNEANGNTSIPHQAYYAIQRQKWTDEVPAAQAALRTKMGLPAPVSVRAVDQYQSKVIPDVSQRKLVIAEDAEGPQIHIKKIREAKGAKAAVDVQIPFSQRLGQLAAAGGALDVLRAKFIDSLIPPNKMDPAAAQNAVQRGKDRLGKGIAVKGTIEVN